MRPKKRISGASGTGAATPPTPMRPIIHPGDLVIDIETAPILAYTWGTFKQNVNIPDGVVEDWSILSYAAKWVGQSKIFYQDTGGRGTDKVRDDSILMPGLWALLDQAKVVIAQNGRRFDMKKIAWRMAVHRIGPPAPGRIYDTLLASRGLFAATSHKLAWLSAELTDEPKSKHRQFPGMELWVECLKENPLAWVEMKRYNIQDIKATEKLWVRQQEWVQNRWKLGTYDARALVPE